MYKSDKSTFSRKSIVNISIINLIFIILKLNQRSTSWAIEEEEVTDSDYEVILFLIGLAEEKCVQNSLQQGTYNFDKAN